MTNHHKFSSLVAAIVAVCLVAPGGAWAGGDRQHNDRYGRIASPNRHRDYRHHDRWVPEPRHDYRFKHHNRHHGSDEDLLVGLLFGGLVGYAIANSQPPRGYEYDRRPPVGAPPPQVSYPSSYYEYEDRGPACLQEREYQMMVIIGGREQEAYGTACLQPDGSWIRGPARLVAY